MTPDETKQLVSAISQIITWSLVVAGWWVVHRATLKRERRKEELELIGGIRGRIVDLRNQAIDYYTKVGLGQERFAAEARLKYELQSLVRTIDLLRLRKPRHYDLSSEIIYLRQAITGGDFESGTRSLVTHDHTSIQTIWLSTDNLIVALRAELEQANPS